MAYGPKVSHSALAMGGLQLLKPGRVVPNISPFLFVKSIVVVKPVKPTVCCCQMQSRENNLHIHHKAQIRIKTRRHPRTAMTQTCKFSPLNQFLGFSHYKLLWRVWNTFCSIRHLMSLSCGWSSSWSWSVCPLRLVKNVPCRQ